MLIIQYRYNMSKHKIALIIASLFVTTSVYAETNIQEPQNVTQESNLFVLEDIKTSGMNHVDGAFLRNMIDLHIGKQFSESSIPKLEKALMDSGFFQSIQVVRENNTLVFVAKENPVVNNIKIDGNKSFNTKELTSQLQQNHIGKNLTYNQKLMKQYVDNLQKTYYAKGRQHVAITVDEQINNDTVDLKLNITENPSTKINHIQFTGNNTYSDKQLLRLMSLSPKGGMNLITDKLDQNKLRDDLNKIVNFYHENGYFNAGTEDVKFIDVGTAEKPMQDINVILNEGTIYHFDKPVVNMSENANKILSQKVLETLIDVKEGDLYQKSKVENTIQNLTRELTNQGYAFAEVDVQTNQNADKVQFVFNIKEQSSKPVTINQYNINYIDRYGNKAKKPKTKQKVILREMRQKNGETYNLSKLQRSKERLDLTGYFNDVSMNTKTVEGNHDLVDIDVTVQERNTGAVQASVGYMQDYGLTLGVGVSDRNFKGTGNTVGVNVNYNKVQKNADINYSNPFFFTMNNKGVSLDSSIYGSEYNPTKDKDSYQNYKTTKYGTMFNFGIPLNEYDKIYTGLDIEHMGLKTFSNAPQRYHDFINQHGKNNGNGSGQFKGWLPKFTLGWGRNTTNHAYWATKGYIANVNGEITIPSVSKLDFYKLETNGKYFIPVGKSGAALMLGGKVGYANSYRKTKELPFFENYYGGGLGFVRGFESGTLGAKVHNRNNDIVTYGGNKIAGGTMELFMPLPQFIIKDSSNVRLSAFIDAGSVWDGKTYTAKDSDNGVSVYKDNYKSSFKNEFRSSIGAAWTWLSPIGPVKFSYAQPLQKKTEDQIQKFQFQLGTTF